MISKKTKIPKSDEGKTKIVLQNKETLGQVAQAKSTTESLDVNLNPDLFHPMTSGYRLGYFTRLQQTYGNQYVQRLVSHHANKIPNIPLIKRQVEEKDEEEPIQGKFKINQANDKYEQEADKVAAMVMSSPQLKVQTQQGEVEKKIQTKSIVGQITPLIQREIQIEEEEAVLHTKMENNHAPKMTSEIVGNINNLQRGGHQLSKSARTFFEPRFGYDFRTLRIHDDAKAAKAASEINARAFTVGHNIVFGYGQYNPETKAGKTLIAHELVHIIQQQNLPLLIQREDNNENAESAEGASEEITFTLNITPQILWAITALSIRPVREEDTWACLGGVGEYDKPRILQNYFGQYTGNSAFQQIDSQRPPEIERDAYLRAVFQYLWSLIRDEFMALIEARIRRNSRFREKVERVRGGYGCARVPAVLPEGEVAV